MTPWSLTFIHLPVSGEKIDKPSGTDVQRSSVENSISPLGPEDPVIAAAMIQVSSVMRS